ncbi:MAG TPA: hypothetical protein DHV42_03855 [Lachnospiraceae bacterium]|nr:hypothetical protein [Lachnospiraceae bacterium]
MIICVSYIWPQCGRNLPARLFEADPVRHISEQLLRICSEITNVQTYLGFMIPRRCKFSVMYHAWLPDGRPVGQSGDRADGIRHQGTVFSTVQIRGPVTIVIIGV